MTQHEETLTQTQIELITNLTQGAESTIEKYTEWYFTESLIELFTFTGLLVLICLFLRKVITNFDEDNLLQSLGVIVSVTVGFFLVVSLPNTITTLINPEAYSIHSLILDIRGR